MVSQAQGVLSRPLQDGDAQALMRVFHTLKGMSATMGFAGMTLLAHALEDVFEAVRVGRVAGDSAALRLAREGVDAMDAQIDAVVLGVEPTPATALEVRARAFLRTTGTTAFTLLPPSEDDDREASERPKGAHASDALTEVMAASTQLRALVPDDARVTATLDRLHVASRRLYTALAELRTVSFETVLPPLRRHVRSVAALYGRDVRLEVRGESVAVDPVRVAGLQGALVQLLTNAIIHGIEAPEERVRCGKLRTGLLQLTVERTPQKLRLVLTDDGRGFDVEALRTAADQDHGDPVDIAMRSGVSTASTIGLHAGRGQGLGAVRAAIEAQGGTMTVTMTSGRGASFQLDLPAADELCDLVLLEQGAQTFALPVAALVAVGAVPRLSEGRLLLRDGRSLVIDRVVGTVEALVSLPPFPISLLPLVTGTTIAPDGSVLFVLDAACLNPLGLNPLGLNPLGITHGV